MSNTKEAKLMQEVIIYTDGACSGNPGPGGWAAILSYNGIFKEIAGAQEETTNNRMELIAAIKALQALKRPCTVNLYTDSAYLCNAFLNGWITNWQKNGWKNTKKDPVENKELWEELLHQSAIHTVNWHKVKGHSDNEFNNKCDKLARDQIKALKNKSAKNTQNADN